MWYRRIILAIRRFSSPFQLYKSTFRRSFFSWCFSCLMMLKCWQEYCCSKSLLDLLCSTITAAVNPCNKGANVPKNKTSISMVDGREDRGQWVFLPHTVLLEAGSTPKEQNRSEGNSRILDWPASLVFFSVFWCFLTPKTQSQIVQFSLHQRKSDFGKKVLLSRIREDIVSLSNSLASLSLHTSVHF